MGVGLGLGGRAAPATLTLTLTQAPLDLLAAPPWEEVCRAAGDTGAVASLPQTALEVVRHALVEAGYKHVGAVLEERLLSRAMGAVARNAFWVQVPNPLVYYISAFDERLRSDAACAAALPGLAQAIGRSMGRYSGDMAEI